MNRWKKRRSSFQEKIINRSEPNTMNKTNKKIRLESTILLQRNSSGRLTIKYDDNEEYSQRSYLRVHEIKFSPNENGWRQCS